MQYDSKICNLHYSNDIFDIFLFSTEIIPIILRICFFLYLFEIKYRLFYNFMPLISESSTNSIKNFRTWWAIKLVNLVHALIVSIIALYALLNDFNMLEIFRSLKNFDILVLYETILTIPETTFCPILVTYTVGFFIWDLLHYTQAENFPLLMIFHHTLSIIVWPIALYNGLANFFLLHFMVSELSTPFIHIRWYINKVYGKNILWLLVTLLFIITFIIVRILVIPYLIYGLYRAEIINHYEIDLRLRILAISTLYLPSLLNLFWFFYIIRMCKKFIIKLLN